MAITPPTPPTPPSPPKITLGDAARDAQANQTHTTGDAQAEQQARDSVAQGNGALSKTTHEKPKSQNSAEHPNAAARTDAAKGDSVSTSASKVDRGTKVEGQTGADVASGLDMAQENAVLKQQLAGTEQKTPEAPHSYTATSGLYYAGMIVAALVLGMVLFRRFFQKKPETAAMEEPSLGERILAHDRERTARADESHARDTERGVHDDLLAAAEQTRTPARVHGADGGRGTGASGGGGDGCGTHTVNCGGTAAPHTCACRRTEARCTGPWSDETNAARTTPDHALRAENICKKHKEPGGCRGEAALRGACLMRIHARIA